MFSAIRLGLALEAALLFSGCHSEVWHVTEQVDPGVIRDIRSIGTVVAEETSDITWDGLTTISNVFVVDVSGSAPEPSLSAATALLEKRGWANTHAPRPNKAQMRSTHWGAMVLIQEFGDDSIAEAGRIILEDPAAAALAEEAQAKNSSEHFVIIEASPYDVD